MVEDPSEYFQGVLDVGQVVDLVGVPYDVHVVARHEELVRVLLLKKEILMVPTDCRFEEVFISIMGQRHLVEEHLLPLGSCYNVIGKITWWKNLWSLVCFCFIGFIRKKLLPKVFSSSFSLLVFVWLEVKRRDTGKG